MQAIDKFWIRQAAISARDARQYAAMASKWLWTAVCRLWWATWRFRHMRFYKRAYHQYLSLDEYWLRSAKMHMRDGLWAIRRTASAARELVKSVWRSTWLIRHRRGA